MSTDLKKIAEEEKLRVTTEVPEEVVNEVPDEDAPAIIIGSTKKKTGKKPIPPIEIDDDGISDDPDLAAPNMNTPAKETGAAITEDDLKAVMPDLDDEYFKQTAAAMKDTLEEYQKNLIINLGFTVEEALKATHNKLNKDGFKINKEYLEENPKLGIVEVNKKDVEKLEFTPEETNKLTKAKAIKLVVVEDADLKSIKVDTVDKKHKTNYLNNIEGSLCKYSVPLPILNDFVVFKGAQIIQLMQTTKYDDDHLEDLFAKKASLIYDRMTGGAFYNKYDDEGNVKMTYADFANSFKFHDMDLAMFAILVASNIEETESTLTCSTCNSSFQWKYNLKNLLNLDKISEDFKERINSILGDKSNADILQAGHDKYNKTIRYMSPLSKNMFDINTPSVARVIKLFSAIDQKDQTMTYLAAIAMYIKSLYIYNSKTDSYLQIDEDEISLMMEALQSLPQTDIDIIMMQAKEITYMPRFLLKSKCPKCAEQMENELSVEELVFIQAQDSLMEIR